MQAFLILYKGVASEWLPEFHDVQVKMNELEKEGIVSNVTVQQFVHRKLHKQLTYDYNGFKWEKRKQA